MSWRARLRVAIALLMIAGLIAVLNAPRYLERKIQKTLAAHPEIHVEGLRVRPFLGVEIDAVHLALEDIAGSCHNVVLRPRLALRDEAPKLHHIEIERCELRLRTPQSDATDEHSEHDEETTAASIGERLESAYEKMADRLSITRSIDLHALDVHIQHPDTQLRAVAKALHWEQGFTHHSAAGTLQFSGDFESGEVVVSLKVKKDSSRIDLRTEAPFLRGEHTLSVEHIALLDWHHLEIETVQLRTPHPLVERAQLDAVRLSLDTPLRLESEGGALHLTHSDLAETILADARPEESPVELQRLSDDVPAAPDQLWSLRTLSRARRLVARLDELLHDPTERAPLNLDLQNIAIHHDDEALMHIERVRFDDDAPLLVDARISDATLTLRADAEDPGLWHFSVDDASLQRIASFVELDAYLDGRVDAKLVFRMMHETLTIGGELALRNGVVDHPGVSDEPVTPLHIEGMLSASLPADPLADVHAEYAFQVNEIPFTMSLRAIPVGERARFIADVTMDEATPCQQIWEALPKGLVSDLGHASVQLRGTATPRFSLNYVAGVFDSFVLSVNGFPESCTIVVHALRFDPKRLHRNDFVFHVTEGVSSNAIFVGPGVKDYVRLDTLPSYIPALMYLSEEINFYNNPGISLGLINKAIRHSLPRRRFAYGGSTVTQQLVKNLYFSRDKTLARKLQEAVIVWAVESTVRKDRILELYMNCIEFGPDLYGIVRASRHYFGKEPAELTPLEAAWLASLKPSPVRGRRDFQRGYSDFENWNSQRNEELLWRLVRYGEHIEPEAVAAAAPYVVFFPTSPNAGAKPEGYDARVEALKAEQLAADEEDEEDEATTEANGEAPPTRE